MALLPRKVWKPVVVDAKCLRAVLKLSYALLPFCGIQQNNIEKNYPDLQYMRQFYGTCVYWELSL